MSYTDHWTYRVAKQTVDEALETDQVDGVNRLVQALLLRIKGDQANCKGHGRCLITGHCPFHPECDRR